MRVPDRGDAARRAAMPRGGPAWVSAFRCGEHRWGAYRLAVRPPHARVPASRSDQMQCGFADVSESMERVEPRASAVYETTAGFPRVIPSKCGESFGRMLLSDGLDDPDREARMSALVDPLQQRGMAATP